MFDSGDTAMPTWERYSGQVHDGKFKEIRGLKTHVVLAKERYALLSSQFEAIQLELREVKKDTSAHEREASLAADRATSAENELHRVDNILNVAVAAKLSSDQ